MQFLQSLHVTLRATQAPPFAAVAPVKAAATEKICNTFSNHGSRLAGMNSLNRTVKSHVATSTRYDNAEHSCALPSYGLNLTASPWCARAASASAIERDRPRAGGRVSSLLCARGPSAQTLCRSCMHRVSRAGCVCGQIPGKCYRSRAERGRQLTQPPGSVMPGLHDGAVHGAAGCAEPPQMGRTCRRSDIMMRASGSQTRKR